MTHRYLDYILSLGEYSQLDRNGFIFKAIRKFLNKSSVGFPMDRTSKKVNFDIRVTNNYNNYDGYNFSDWPSILEDIKDLDCIMLSNNILLTKTVLPLFDHFLLIDKDDQFHSDTDDYEDDE
ncbi:hypothetical protein PPL_03247 [Heterostelium album PN500]|uniref:Uncharacterized protein n=1 Tax=Heterostelium pallidum (strain ATCC 26659 / Pp 5 / PN500) TaxID=670386 RepID=D3B4C5_HETP5|nr:hypothetical protein PPL_03247 [Heterostelium album PN500]EFA84173.1 hypothetical protein PPL_03247 [Heterostelium album PN500]|eukprot:XP_020436290.1 hypothetical protein PPL_03247 [Heterostelium album PN500]